nr:MAG TPA: hypothetical protein [Caudoviricetes sp.]
MLLKFVALPTPINSFNKNSILSKNYNISTTI